MRPGINITGLRFGRLVAVNPTIAKRRTIWQCICDCGGSKKIPSSALTSGRTRSCGCLRREEFSKRRYIHGRGYKDGTYRSWHSMKMRCLNPKGQFYYCYGGRGIKVCERWMNFENFLADMGEKPADLSLDRINNDGNYEPGNCRWATAIQQANNTRRSRGNRA